MNQRSLKNGIISIVFIAYIILYRLLIFKNYMKFAEVISASFLIILLVVAIKLLGFRKDKPTMLSKNVLKVTIFYLVLAFSIMYGLGLVVGFLHNAYSRNIFSLFDNMFLPIIIIAVVEMIRYVVIWANKDKKGYIVLFTVILILFELALGVRTINLEDFASTFSIAATIIVPVIVKNSILSYLCYHVGYKVPLVYRLVMDTYIFIVPIISDIGDYMNSMILLSLPFLIYITAFPMIDERTTKEEPIFKIDNFSFLNIPIMILLVALIALISGFFPHYMIGIGSDSMNPKINKGDAVIIKKLNKKTEVKQKDIIAYTKGNRIVVHRVVNVNKNKDRITYTTKGDANNSKDPQDVKRKEIKGIVKFKIPFIAYPTVWLSELING